MVIKLLRQLAGGQDTFSRHLGVAMLLRPFKAGSIIDIGGEGRLGIFTRQARVTTVNVAGGSGVDHVLNPGTLPFANDSFDAAVSIDTLEHIPKPDRERFLSEMLRVSRKCIIACAPLGTGQHSEYEQQLLASGRIHGQDAAYLREHIANGLPRPDEITSWASRYGAELFYQGDFRGRGLKPGTRLLNICMNALGNARFYFLAVRGTVLKASYDPYTNRFFLVAAKQAKTQARDGT
jgi:hypothetical protein